MKTQSKFKFKSPATFQVNKKVSKKANKKVNKNINIIKAELDYKVVSAQR